MNAPDPMPVSSELAKAAEAAGLDPARVHIERIDDETGSTPSTHPASAGLTIGPGRSGA